MKKIELPAAGHCFSVLQLLARGIFPRAVGVILLTVAVQVGMVVWFLQTQPIECYTALFVEAPLVWVARVGLVLLLLVLVVQGCSGRGSQCGYTWRRLPLPEGTSLLLHMLYSLLVLIAYWGALVAVILGTCLAMVRLYPTALAGTQSLMLLLYHSPYTHNLLPLAAVGRWILLVLAGIALSVGAGCYGVHQRRGQPAFGIFVAGGFCLLNLNNTVNTDKTLSCITLAILTAVLLFNVTNRLQEE